jgi:hypothetical protein
LISFTTDLISHFIGPHVEQQTIDGNYGPSAAMFFPTFTFFGDQVIFLFLKQ